MVKEAATLLQSCYYRMNAINKCNESNSALVDESRTRSNLNQVVRS